MFELLINLFINYLKRNVLGLTKVTDVWSYVVVVYVHENVKIKNYRGVSVAKTY